MLGGENALNMTHLALNLSSHINGVVKKHGEVSKAMFPGQLIDCITNGVHSATWTSKSFRVLFDVMFPAGPATPRRCGMRWAFRGRIWQAHMVAKRRLLDEVQRTTPVSLAPDVLTIGFARRATQYKRAGLILSDIEKLRDIARNVGPIQMVFAGKAHPKDNGGKDEIRLVFEASRRLASDVAVVYLPNSTSSWRNSSRPGPTCG